MRTTTRENVMFQARQLFNDTTKEENPEYLRALCEIIAYSFQGMDTDISSEVEDVEKDLLASSEFEQKAEYVPGHDFLHQADGLTAEEIAEEQQFIQDWVASSVEAKGGIKPVQYSLDDGLTWSNVDNSIRVCYNEISEDEIGFHDLYVTATTEGLVMDIWEQREEGECIATNSFCVEELVALTVDSIVDDLFENCFDDDHEDSSCDFEDDDDGEDCDGDCRNCDLDCEDRDDSAGVTWN